MGAWVDVGPFICTPTTLLSTAAMSLAQKLQGKLSHSPQSETSSQEPEKVLQEFIEVSYSVRSRPVQYSPAGCICRRTQTRHILLTVNVMHHNLRYAEKEKRRAESASWFVRACLCYASYGSSSFSSDAYRCRCIRHDSSRLCRCVA